MTIDTLSPISGVAFGEKITHKRMSVIPLIRESEEGPSYLTLRQAQDKGSISIIEVDEGGSVPELKVRNQADQPVLLLDGEELVGAKQNRVLNTSVLLREHSTTLIPVSCTEQGRWSYDSPEFSDSEIIMSPKIRSSKTLSVSKSLREDGSFRSDQGEVWDEIAKLSDDAEVDSHTQAMRDIFESKKMELAEYIDAFKPIAGQNGLLVSIDDNVVGFDVLSRSEAYVHLSDKLVKSYALDALVRPKRQCKNHKVITVDDFLAMIAKSSHTMHNSIGYGQDYRYNGSGIVGSALVVKDACIHSAFFSNDDNNSTVEEKMIASSKRRGFRLE